MGVVSLPKIPQYWSTRWPFHSSNFSRILSHDRFQLVLKFLHLVYNTQQVPRGLPRHDKLFKLRPLLDYLIPRFQQVFTPGKEIAVDESMIGYKGRLSFPQYMPKKPHKWGMKAWALADSNTGYIWNWKLYTGKDDDAEQGKLLGERVVLELTKKTLPQGLPPLF